MKNRTTIKIKKITIILAVFLLNFNFLYAADNMPYAKSSIVMDVNTGRILYSNNPNQKLPMASTTKIMTVFLAIENADLNDIVKVSKKASFQTGSSVYLKEGDKMRLEDLLYCVMLRSGNDAAVATAEHISGSVEDFAKLMNEKAKQMGAKNSNFTNPHGLPDDNHYTTAYDLALITRQALKNDTFAKIVRSKNHTITKVISEDRFLQNKNKMLWQYPGSDGVKTGYTGKAGKCLVSSASKDGWQILTVVLNTGDIWDSSTKLLDYGFNNYDKIKIVDKNSIAYELDVLKGKEKTVKAVPTEELYAPLFKNKEGYEVVEYLYEPPEVVKAPIKKNEKAGVLKVYADNFLLGSVDLMYNKDIESSDVFYQFRKILKNFLNMRLLEGV